MRKKLLIFGIAVFLIGVMLNFYCLANDKININQMTAADWAETSIPKVGAITEQKIIANAPYDRIQQIDQIDGIGKVKMKEIERRFTTYDTCRAGIHVTALVVSSIFVMVGAIIIIFVFEERRYTIDILNKVIQENVIKEK